MTITSFIGGILGLLVLGGLAMTQMPSHWQNTTGWLLLSLIGIPMFCIAIAIMIKVPVLLFGALVFAGFHAGRSR